MQLVRRSHDIVLIDNTPHPPHPPYRLAFFDAADLENKPAVEFVITYAALPASPLPPNPDQATCAVTDVDQVSFDRV